MMKSIAAEGAFGARSLTQEDFLSLGLNQLAYMKPIRVMGRKAWAVHAADGSPLTLMQEDQATASAALRQNDLIAVSVH